MKRIFIIVCACAVFNTCIAQQKVAPDFPKEMLPHVQEEYLKQFNKGQVLYTMNCGKCHNIQVGRKQVLPNFSENQLVGYALRILNPDHEDGIPETMVTEEELGLIMVFLRYKKESPPVNK